MKPGRELDALVAEKVMGWPGNTCHAYWHDPDVRLSGRPAGRTVSLGELSVSGRELELPHYSTDISAAWEVLHNWTLEDNCWEIGKTEPCGRLVYCKLTTWDSVDNTYRYFVEKASTVPHAICLAALKATGSHTGHFPEK